MDTSLAPHLVEEWNHARNELELNMVTPKSSHSVWWICRKGHEWKAVIYSRTAGSNCPYCSNRRILQGYNDLKTINPDLSREWHPSKNENLNPQNIGTGSKKKAWWLGKCGHEWEASIQKRHEGRGCPVCSSRKVLVGFNDLATLAPQVASEWHPTKNTFSPTEVTGQSNKRAWWLGQCGHEWSAKISDRSRNGNGCSICAGRGVFEGFNDIFTSHPHTRELWAADLNAREGSSVPSKGSDKKVWWKCRKDHLWKAPASTIVKGVGCPVCSGYKCVEGINDLATTHPLLALEWHPNKNELVTPNSIIAGSNYRAWWQCDKGHEWESKVETRKYSKTSCPTCWASDRISKPEKEILDFLTGCGLIVEHSNRKILPNRQELDFYLPEKKIGIEFNGLYWHSESAGRSEDYHRAKWLAAKEAEVQLIQLWEDDWRERKHIAMRTISHRLGVSPKINELNIGNVLPDAMTVSTITSEEANNFLTQNHLDGFSSGSYYLGLIDPSGVICSVMVLRVELNQALHILRYAGYPMSEAFSKMLEYARSAYKPDFFIADADHCLSEEILYEDNGFVVDKEIAPDFTYLFKAVRNPKSDYPLDRFRSDPTLQWEEGLNESELAKLNKLHRIWDAGKTRYKKDASAK